MLLLKNNISDVEFPLRGGGGVANSVCCAPSVNQIYIRTLVLEIPYAVLIYAPNCSSVNIYQMLVLTTVIISKTVIAINIGFMNWSNVIVLSNTQIVK